MQTMSSGLVDIHVLEETVARVNELTDSITKQVTIVEEVSHNADKALGPATKQSRALGVYRENLLGLLSIYEQIEQATKDVNEIVTLIEAGPAKSGWQSYTQYVERAHELSNELSENPQIKRFPQLPENARDQFEIGLENLKNYVGRLGVAVFTPIDGGKHLTKGEQLYEFKPEELSAFSQLISTLDKWPQISDGIDGEVMTAVERFYSKSTASVLPKMGAGPGQFSVQAVGELLERLREILNNGLQILFNRNPVRLRKFMDVNTEVMERTLSSAKGQYKSSSSKIAPPSHEAKTGPKIVTKTKSPPHEGSVPPHVSDGYNKSPSATSNKPDLALNTQAVDTQPNHGPYNSPGGASFNFSNSPKSSSNKTPQHAGTTQFTSPPQQQYTSPQQQYTSPQQQYTSPQQLTTPKAPANQTGQPMGSQITAVNSPSTGSMGSPLTGSAAGTTSGAAQQWAPLEALENQRQHELSPQDLSRAKQLSVGILMNVFHGIEQTTLRSPITSEFGVSGASIQFMQTLKQISSFQHGIDIVLSEMPTRGYLSVPPPSWAQKSEPTAAGRANPVSQYNADIIECMYANLHQVGKDRLKDVIRTGIFMVANFTAIEQYITDNKSLQTMNGQKTPLMEGMGDVALQRFQKLLKMAFNEYLTDWSKLASVIMESTLTTGGNQGKLSSKDREVIKDKFKTFNAEFERLTEKQRKYNINNPILRARLGLEVQKLIGPLYKRFYGKHSSGDFTKNLNKYVKYDLDSFNRALQF